MQHSFFIKQRKNSIQEYKAKIHDIEELGSQAEAINEEFKKIFPRDSSEKDERFKLLKKAYIDARYRRIILSLKRTWNI